MEALISHSTANKYWTSGSNKLPATIIEIPLRSATAEQGVAVDRFAREIVGFLKSSDAARSRQLNAKPFGRLTIPFYQVV